MIKSIFKNIEHELRFRREGYLILDLLSSDDIACMQDCFRTVEGLQRGPIALSVLSDQLAERKVIHMALQPIFSRRLLPALNDYHIPSVIFSEQQDLGNAGPDSDIAIWCPLGEANQATLTLVMRPRSRHSRPHGRHRGTAQDSEFTVLLEQGVSSVLQIQSGQILFMERSMAQWTQPAGCIQPGSVATALAIPRQQQLLYCHADPTDYRHRSGSLRAQESIYPRHVLA